MSISFETLALAKRYTRDAVADAIGGITTIDFRFVETLPLVGEAGVIYCVPVNNDDASDLYDEYYYINGRFERLPGVRIDLTPYATKNWVTGEGYYKKPLNGIPGSDLDAASRVAIAKAETALQEHQSLAAYRTAAQQDEHDAAYIEKLDGIEAHAQVNVDEIAVGNTQPTDPNVKLWMYQNPGQKIEIPTMEDFRNLKPATDEQVSAAVSNWLEENISGGETIAVDKSLSVEGAAADAKTVGELKSAISDDFVSMLSLPHVLNSYTNVATGEFVDYDNWTRSEYIKVPAIGKLAFRGVSYCSTYNAFYTEGKELVRAFTLVVGENEIEVPQNARYFVVSTRTADFANTNVQNPLYYADERKIKEYIDGSCDILAKNDLKDLNILCLGDSFFGNDNEIVTFLADLTKANVINGAVGGTRATDRGGSDAYQYFDGVNLITALTTGVWTNQDAAVAGTLSNWSERLATLKSVNLADIDLIILNWGTNDWQADVTMTDINTAYATIVEKLRTAQPKVRELIISPTWRYTAPKSSNVNGDTYSRASGTLEEMSVALEEQAHKLKVEFLQMYFKMPLNYDTCDYYFDSGSTVHLNTNGNMVYTHILNGKLKSMY